MLKQRGPDTSDSISKMSPARHGKANEKTMCFPLPSSSAHISRGHATTVQPDSLQLPRFPRAGIVFVIQVNLKGKCPGVGALGCLVISELRGTLPLCCHQRKDKGFGPGGPGKLDTFAGILWDCYCCFTFKYRAANAGY